MNDSVCDKVSWAMVGIAAMRGAFVTRYTPFVDQLGCLVHIIVTVYSYGLYSYGLCSHGLYSYGLYSYGLCSYGL